MAMRRLVRTPFVVRSFMRGGHGWERPDVPLSEPYVNRRHYYWVSSAQHFIDAFQPEYSLSNNEVYQEDPVQGPENNLAMCTFVGAFFVGLLVLDKIFLNYRKVEARDWETVEIQAGEATKYDKDRLAQKYISNNPFGLTLTIDQSISPKQTGYVKPEYIADIEAYKKVVAEGQAFIERKIAEATKQVQEGKSRH